MKTQKYIDIKVEGQGNIGVIDLGKIDSKDWEKRKGADMKSLVEKKMVEALKSHFDCPVKIILTEILTTLGHITLRSSVIVEADGGDYQETVEMEETWVY